MLVKSKSTKFPLWEFKKHVTYMRESKINKNDKIKESLVVFLQQNKGLSLASKNNGSKETTNFQKALEIFQIIVHDGQNASSLK